MADSQQIPETRTVSPRGVRWRRWAVVGVVALVLCGWFARFAYLRITLRPTPRPEYWEAELAALQAKYKAKCEELEARVEADRWISVEERLPESDGVYLILWDDGDWDKQYFSPYGAFSPAITHWRPVPEFKE